MLNLVIGLFIGVLIVPKKTESYSERTHESIGAPGYVYTDTLIRTRRVPISKEGDMLNPLKPGINIGDRYVYYFEFCVNPKIGDQIFELNLTNHKCKPIITPALYKERFTIERVHDYRLENGNVQYYIVNCGYDEMSY